MADREGSPGANGRVFVELAITAMRAGDIVEVQDLSDKARMAMPGGGPLHFVAAVPALEAWVAYRDKRMEAAVLLGNEALTEWESQSRCYPFQCLALFPLLGAHLDLGHIDYAVRAVRQLLEPSQIQLPEELENVVLTPSAAGTTELCAP